MGNRLTDKCQVTSSDLFRMEVDCDLEEVAKWYNKLSKLEDLEEELGIDLTTLIKALESPKLWFIWKGDIMDARKINVFFYVDEKRVWFRFSGEFMPKGGH